MRSCRGLLVAALDAVWKILQRDSDARPMDGMAATASFRRVRRAGAIAAIATACALPFPVRSEFIFPHVSHWPGQSLAIFQSSNLGTSRGSFSFCSFGNIFYLVTNSSYRYWDYNQHRKKETTLTRPQR